MQNTETMYSESIYSVKSINADEGRVGGYLVVWGDAVQRDLEGEYFTPDTELGLDWYDRRPVLFHHGMDGQVKSAVIGVIDTLRADSNRRVGGGAVRYASTLCACGSQID